MKFAQRPVPLPIFLLGLMLLMAPVFQSCSSPKATTEQAAAPAVQEVAAKRYKQEARTKYDKQDYKGAIASWTEFIAANDNKGSEESAYYNRGRAQMKLKNAKAAEQDFSEALKLDPNSAKTYDKRAEARSALGNKAGTTADLQQAIALYKKQGKDKEAQKVEARLTQVQQGVPLTEKSASEPAPAKSTTSL